MTCCDRCGGVHGRTYQVLASDDGLEFLTETGLGPTGEHLTTTVVWCAPGVPEPF